MAAERRVGAALGAGLAASPFVALTAIGYAPNVLVDVLGVAAVALARPGSGGKGVVGLVVLLAAAVIAHWLFAFLLVLLLGAYAAGVALATWLRRGANRPGGIPAPDLGIGLGAVLGALLLFVSPERPDKVPTGARQDTPAKIQARLPEMALRVTIPLAAAGGIVMWASRRPTTRRVLPPLAMWAAVAPAGLLAWKLFDVAVPYRTCPSPWAYRSRPCSAPPRPVVDRRDGGSARPQGMGVGGCGRERHPRARRHVVAHLRGAGPGRAEAGFTPAQYEQAATLAAYLETAPPNTRVVVPMAPACSGRSGR